MSWKLFATNRENVQKRQPSAAQGTQLTPSTHGHHLAPVLKCHCRDFLLFDLLLSAVEVFFNLLRKKVVKREQLSFLQLPRKDEDHRAAPSGHKDPAECAKGGKKG